MSTEGASGSRERAAGAAAARSLGDYIQALIAVLEESDPAAHARLRRAVDGRRARIELGDEAVVVGYRGAVLEVGPATGEEPVHGRGSTDLETVRDLLHGHLEVVDAILDGRLQVAGDSEDVERIFLAIEILLDAAPRTPQLQRLAADLLATAPAGPGTSVAPRARAAWSTAELDLLNRLDLLP
jgi:hypothetical protein